MGSLCSIAKVMLIHLHAETNSTIMTNEHISFKKYTSHTLFERVAKRLRKGCERVVCERWVGYWTDCNILTPVPLTIAALLSHSAGLLNRGSTWAAQPGGALCWELVLTALNCNSNFNCNWLPLTRTLCGTGLYNFLISTCFLWASHLHLIQPVHGQGYILMSSTGCTCFSIDGWVEGQYVTFVLCYIFLALNDVSKILFC